MSTKIPFPNDRLVNVGLGNPLFVSDIQNSTQNLNEAINLILGLPSNGFAILRGLDYNSGAHTYNAGVVYMNGVVYLCATGLAENQYLAPSLVDEYSKINSDGNAYNSYRVYYAIASNSVVGGMPQFVGAMNQYRFNMTSMKGSTIGKVPVIGPSWDNSALVAINTDGEVESGAFIGITVNEIPNIQSTLTPGQTVKVGSTGLVSEDLGDVLLTKIVNIGDWNMDSTSTKAVAHGISNYKKIRSISCIVRSDDDSEYLNLNVSIGSSEGSYKSAGYINGVSLLDSSNIALARESGMYFDSTSFDSTSYNRGWVTIQYIP